MAEVQAPLPPPVEKEREEEAVSWSPEVEVCLFHAMLGHKPVGVNRHFHMICIRDKFSQNIGRQVSSKIVWEHLNVMYDMQALHESEILPFPNGERNFVLPEDIIHEVKEGKSGPEEELKDEHKEELLEQPLADEGNMKMMEKPAVKERTLVAGELGTKEVIDKRKRNRATVNLLSVSSNPSSPSGAKRRRI
ncbi:MRG/MORF4L-binding protein isoform X2 [Hemiscyllium ocellatum]|uniref:MRG/MORF4L-binding protein isoform X2 n=1 Tax=Hemiscyllium ocellatum TaxID=170820 RepID=UPI0029671669|nr:MRG/MORF4L-binding protein isoform X2 [Hemiscyllium ocellatum]